MTTFNTVAAWNTFGADGESETADAQVIVDFSGTGSRKKTPEHLFACAYAASFGTTLRVMGKILNTEIPDATKVFVTISSKQDDDKGLFLEGEISVSLPGWKRDVAEQFANGAHEVCPYSKAILNNVPIKLTVL